MTGLLKLATDKMGEKDHTSRYQSLANFEEYLNYGVAPLNS